VTASIQPSEARVWLEVDLERLVANARTVSATAGVPILPMVKANGYGLGAVAVAKALEAVDPWGYGVATWPEAEELRRAGIARPLIVFTPWVPGVESSESRVRGVRRVIGDVESLGALLSENSQLPTPHSQLFHLEIDTGMSRSGIRWNDHAALQRAAELLADAEGWEGVFTHFHSSESDLRATEEQWDRFVEALCWFPRRPRFVHAANSAGALRGKLFAGDLVRPGIYLYGGGVGEWAPAPQVVATLRTRVVGVRRLEAGESVSYNATWRAEGPVEIATLACGYADGLLRSGSGKIRVEIAGAVVPVVGRITMDMTMVAVPAGSVRVGAVATIFGGQVSLADHAAALGTNVYEALTAVGPRTPRVHRSGR
jgi:alanine racemase